MVFFWSRTMALFFRTGLSYNYNEDEKKSVRALAAVMPSASFATHLILGIFYFLLLLGPLLTVGLLGGAVLFRADSNMPVSSRDTAFGDAISFAIYGGIAAVFAFGVGAPLGIAFSVKTLRSQTESLVAPPDVSEETLVALYWKLIGQLLRYALVAGVLFMVGAIMNYAKVSFAIIALVLVPLSFVLAALLGFLFRAKK